MATDKSFFVSVTHSLATYIEQKLGMRRGAHFRFVKVVPSYKVLTLWLAINPTYTKAILGMTKELSQAALADLNVAFGLQRPELLMIVNAREVEYHE